MVRQRSEGSEGDVDEEGRRVFGGVCVGELWVIYLLFKQTWDWIQTI